MEVIETNGNFIVRNGSKALYCDRLSGKLSIKDSGLITSEWNPVCLGQVDGVIGKLRYYPDSSWRLFLIEDSEHVGFLPDGMEIRRISRVCALALTTAPVGDLTLRPCRLEHPAIPKRKNSNSASPGGRRPLIRQVQRRLRDAAGVVDEKLSHNRQRIKYEKRIHEELTRLLRLEDESFFYFSPGGGDVTNWTQSKLAPSYWTGTLPDPTSPMDISVHRQPVWRRADLQFFWNINLLSEPLLDADRLLAAEGIPPYGHESNLQTKWTNQLTQMISDLEGLFPPIVQGYVEVERIPLTNFTPPYSQSPRRKRPPSPRNISRRSPSKNPPPPGISVFYSPICSPQGAQDTDDASRVTIHGLRNSVNTSEVTIDTKDSQPFSSYVPSPSPNKELKTETPRTESTQSSPLHQANSGPTDDDSFVKSAEEITVILFSRRSRHRAGTRYRRRGIDPEGHVANYVETEQILQTHQPNSPQTVAFLQIRGSVPVFWSQTSLKYRPPINLEKTLSENQAAFSKHWDQLLARFEHVVIVNLLDCGPRRSENRLLEAYLRYTLLLNHEKLAFILFDFHDYCRGLRFENASVLLSGTVHLLRDMKFCWATSNELLCEQTGIFRLNCLDCLDRTNLVQCLYAGVVMTTQLKKFGLLGPDDNLPIHCTRLIQRMWANNGDAISQQYAGTVALKGDYTRTGERTMNGMVRDGVSSMSRYYLRFRELARQAAIDLLLGNEASAELALIRSGAGLEAASIQAREESIRLLIHRSRQMLLDPEETNLAECLLSSYTDLAMEQQFANILLVVTDRYLHFIRTDLPVQARRSIYARIPVASIQKVELGLEPSVFRSRRHVLRVFYTPPKPDSSKRDQAEPDSTQSVNQPTTSDLSGGFLKFAAKSEPEEGTVDYSSASELRFSCSDSELPVLSSCPSNPTQPEDVASNASGTKAVTQLPPMIPKQKHSGGGQSESSSRVSKPNAKNRHFLAFVQPNVRLFNTMLVPVPPGDESFQALRVVGAMILVAVRANGRDLELNEYPNRVKLNRVRRASVPNLYQPCVNLETLFADLKLSGRGRDSRRSSHSSHTEEKLLEVCSDGESEKKSINQETFEANISPGRVGALKQRLTKLKLPNLRLKPSQQPLTSNQRTSATSLESASQATNLEPTKRIPSMSDRLFSELSRVIERPIIGGGRLFPRQRTDEEADTRGTQPSPQPPVRITGPDVFDLGSDVDERVSPDSGDPGNTTNLSAISSLPGHESESETEAVEQEYGEKDDEELEEDEQADDEEDAELSLAARDHLLVSCDLAKLTTYPSSKHYRSKSCADAVESKGHRRLLSLDQMSLKRTGDILNILNKSTTQVSNDIKEAQPQNSSISSAEQHPESVLSQKNVKSPPPPIYNPDGAIFKSDSNLVKLGAFSEARRFLLKRFASEQFLNRSISPSTSTRPLLPNELSPFDAGLPKSQSENTLVKEEYIPKIVLNNLKLAERLRKKQLENVVWLDQLRHQLCPNQPIKTSFIIF